MEKSTNIYSFIFGGPKAYFADVLSKKSLLRRDDQIRMMSKVIKKLWAQFWHMYGNIYENLANACAPLLKEFYANINGMKQGQVFMRGKSIKINEEIRKAIGCLKVEDEFSKHRGMSPTLRNQGNIV